MATNVFYVYAYYDVTDPAGDPFYVGKGSGDRYLTHLDKCETGHTMFHRKLRSMLAAGNRPRIEILAPGLGDAEALALEVELIAKYGRRDVGTGCLCNHTNGGEGQAGRVTSDETRLKISISKQGRETPIDERIRHARAMAGHKQSAETRARKRASRADCLPVCSYDLRTGETIKTYPSVNSAKADGYQQQNISKVLSGQRPQHKGVGWRTA